VLRSDYYTRDRDRLFGNRGRDRLNVRDGDSRDTVSGGPGFDVCLADPGDRIGAGCERPSQDHDCRWAGAVQCWRRCPPTETGARGRGEGRCRASATSGITSRSRTAQQAETSQSGLERRPPANAREPAEATKEP